MVTVFGKGFRLLAVRDSPLGERVGTGMRMVAPKEAPHFRPVGERADMRMSRVRTATLRVTPGGSMSQISSTRVKEPEAARIG